MQRLMSTKSKKLKISILIR